MWSRFTAVAVLVGLALIVTGVSVANPTEKPAPTFYKNVLPILQDHCQSCHRAGEPAPMPLETYEQTRLWAPAITHAVEMKMMPPWFADPRYGHFANDSSLTPQQIAAIITWASQGMPAGEPHDAPPARKWISGWNISHPDVVVKMPKP